MSGDWSSDVCSSDLADPHEKRDLAGERPADVKRLTALLDGWWDGR